MDSSTLLRQLLRLPHSSIQVLSVPMRPQTRTFAILALPAPQARFLSAPRVLQPSFWGSMIPKPLRRGSSEAIAAQPAQRRKEWNPATPYIILALLVGSQAIQSLWLKRDRDHFTRQAEAQLEVLREVIEAVQRGEDVDVEKRLGTGDPEREKEWEEILNQLAEEEELFKSKKRRRLERRGAAKNNVEQETDEEDEELFESEKQAGAEGKNATKDAAGQGSQPEEEVQDALSGLKSAQGSKVKAETYKGARFY